MTLLHLYAETHFKVSLSDRKGDVKSVIEEVITNMTDDEDGEDAGSNENDTEDESDEGDGGK